MGVEPAIDPDGAPAEAIIAICEKCPSGALSYSLPDQDRNQAVSGRGPAISLAPRHYDFDGGYDVKGGIPLEDSDGASPESAEHYVLCRCGGSKNKPFCDGTHWHIKFIDDSGSGSAE
jgi:CDGSH-type Zn-finger protein